jgi:N-acetylglutamate synthase/N-acetylornithine aminotransferase
VRLGLNLGAGRYRLLTADLSEAYVNFNKSE